GALGGDPARARQEGRAACDPPAPARRLRRPPAALCRERGAPPRRRPHPRRRRLPPDAPPLPACLRWPRGPRSHSPALTGRPRACVLLSVLLSPGVPFALVYRLSEASRVARPVAIPD